MNIVNNVTKYVKKHSSTIMSVIGSFGVLVTIVCASKSAVNSYKKIKLEECHRGEALTKKECIKVSFKDYIPTAIAGASTIACIVSSDMLSQNSKKALIGAYAMIVNQYDRYRKAVVEKFDNSVDDEIIGNIANCVEKPPKLYFATSTIAGNYSIDSDFPDEKALFYDMFSNRYFESTPHQVLLAEYHINRNFAIKGTMSLNEFYEFLGLDSVPGGDDIGWNAEYMYADGLESAWIDVAHKTAIVDDTECNILSFIIPPDIYQD